MKPIIISILAITIASFITKDKLIGRWQSKPSPKGNITSVFFKSDNSFEGFVNKKPFVTGVYTLQDSIFSFVDNGCNGKKGIYRIIFYSNSDSIRFDPINDSCAERKEGMSKLILGRIK
jgi:hypothetical protein